MAPGSTFLATIDRELLTEDFDLWAIVRGARHPNLYRVRENSRRNPPYRVCGAGECRRRHRSTLWSGTTIARDVTTQVRRRCGTAVKSLERTAALSTFRRERRPSSYSAA